ncbi:MAG: polysaccharide biosynthesis protein [Cyclobacteriaceae bacterium]|nr:polysaccharide biosynthesis protein [Cyclobacteriaceae bacterium]
MWSSAYTYAGAILGFVITAILFPRFLTGSEIGVLSLLVSYSMIFAQLGTLGFTSATVRYFPYFRSEKHHNGFLSMLLITGVTGAILVTVLFFILLPYLRSSNLENSPLFAHFLLLIVPLAVFQLFFFLFDVYCSALFDSTIGTLLKEFVQRVFILISLLMYLLGAVQFEGFTFLYVASICAVTIILIMYLTVRGQFVLKPPDLSYSRPYLKGMAGVSFFGLLNGFSNFASLRIDAIMVNEFFDTSAVGIYTTTFYFGILVALPSRALYKIASPMIAEALKTSDFRALRDIYTKSCMTQFITACFLFMGLWINIDNIFLLLPDEFKAGKYVILYIGLANVIKMGSGVSEGLIAYSKWYKVITWFMLAFLGATVLSNLALIPLMGIDGAALASLIAVSMYSLLRFWFVRIKFHLQPYSLKYLWVVFALILSLGICSVMPTLPNMPFDLAIRSALGAGVFVPVIYFSKASQEINDMILNFTTRIFRKNQ